MLTKRYDESIYFFADDNEEIAYFNGETMALRVGPGFYEKEVPSNPEQMEISDFMYSDEVMDAIMLLMEYGRFKLRTYVKLGG